VPASDLAALSKQWQVVFLNSAPYTANPIKLRRFIIHNDRRFKGLIDTVAPVGRTV
jgi:type IV secretion system protein VirD4